MKFSRPTAFCAACFLAGAMVSRANEPVADPAENPAGHPVMTLIDAPFRFTYGTWEGKAKVEDGVAKFQGFDAKGGAGSCEKMNAPADFRPLLRVIVGPEHTTKVVRLRLRDNQGNTGTWDFDVSQLPKGVATLLPAVDNRPFSQPHAVGENGRHPDTTKITQWQLFGDWSEGRMDLQVSLILATRD